MTSQEKRVRGPRCGRFCPRGVGRVTLSMWMLFAGLEALGPRTLGISVGGMTDHQLHFSVLTSSQSMRGGLRIPSLSSWLGLSEDHPRPGAHPESLSCYIRCV